MGDSSRLYLSGTLVVPRLESGPRDEVRRRWECRHVDSKFRYNCTCGWTFDTGYRGQIIVLFLEVCRAYLLHLLQTQVLVLSGEVKLCLVHGYDINVYKRESAGKGVDDDIPAVLVKGAPMNLFRKNLRRGFALRNEVDNLFISFAVNA